VSTAVQICLFIEVLLSIATGFIAFTKGRGPLAWGVVAFLFGPFTLVVLALLSNVEHVDVTPRSEFSLPPAPAPRPANYERCPKCGRISFTANESGSYYCYACGADVQVAS
jgi:hypothetical protein